MISSKTESFLSDFLLWTYIKNNFKKIIGIFTLLYITSLKYGDLPRQCVDKFSGGNRGVYVKHVHLPTFSGEVELWKTRQ